MHQDEYKGRQIVVDTIQRGSGWTWTYQIDGGKMHSLRDHPLPTEETARIEAIQEAMSVIDSESR